MNRTSLRHPARELQKELSGQVPIPAPPSPDEELLVQKFGARWAVKPPLPATIITMDGSSVDISYKDCPPGLGTFKLMDMLATGDVAFGLGVLSQVANIASLGSEVVGSELDFALAVVKAVDPKDELEALLATQMAAVHINVMAMGRRLRNADGIEARDSASGAFNKLARTFTTQIEALKRHRANGEQTVRVEHVHVHAGGQAIVGNLRQAGGTKKSKATS